MTKPASKPSSAVRPPSNPLADKLLRERFRELAARFDQWATDADGGTLPGTGLDIINRLSADEDAGRVVMCAFHGGHLRDIPHLTELVDWAESKGDYPVAPTFVRCPGNLFGEVVGGGKIQIRNTPGRTVKRGNSVSMDPRDLADEPLGGLLSEMFPGFDEPDRNLKDSLTAPPKNRDWFLLKHEAVGFRRRARACRLLADLIERADRSAAEGKPGSLGRPSGNQQQAWDDSTLSPARLAQHFEVPKEALRKRLERLRKTDHQCFIEVADRSSKEPQFLYYVANVRPVIKAMRASTKTSGKRPAKKKSS